MFGCIPNIAIKNNHPEYNRLQIEIYKTRDRELTKIKQLKLDKYPNSS